MKTVNIPWPEGLVTHAGVIKNVVLREPGYDLYLTHGDPVVWSLAPDGNSFAIENSGALKSYIAACLVEPKDPLLLEGGGMRLARLVKDGMLSFFRGDVAETEISTTSPTNSSSPVNSTQPASAG